MTDYYLYFELEGINQEFIKQFKKLTKKLNMIMELSFDMHGSFNKPEITFNVSEMDFDLRHSTNDRILELLNEFNIKFNFCTAG